MPATCAVCRLPIAKGVGFVLVGTEVIHKTEACIAGAGNTVLARTLKTAQKLKRMAARSNELADQSTKRLKDAFAECDRLLRRARDAERANADLLIDAANAICAKDIAVRERNLTAADLQNALRERDAARAEAALHQTIQGNPSNVGIFQIVADPKVAPEPVKKEDDEDASATRFSLLELT